MSNYSKSNKINKHIYVKPAEYVLRLAFITWKQGRIRNSIFLSCLVSNVLYPVSLSDENKHKPTVSC